MRSRTVQPIRNNGRKRATPPGRGGSDGSSIEARRKRPDATRPCRAFRILRRLRRKRPGRKQRVKKGIRYFDYDLLLVIIFLMCFGLVMLYSTSAYSAQSDFENDMYYFSKQAVISVLSFAAMFIVSKIDYIYMERLRLNFTYSL